MQVFVQPRGNRMLHSSFYRVGRESRAHPLSEARSASAVISWASAQLVHTCLGSHSTQRGLSEGGVLPVLAVRMRLPALWHRGMGGGQRNSDQNELGDPAHTRNECN